MFGWKAKKVSEEPDPYNATEVREDDESIPTWADGSYGPSQPVSRVYGRQRGDEEHEARLAAAL